MKFFVFLCVLIIAISTVHANLENDVRAVTHWLGGFSRDVDSFTRDSLDDIENLASNVRDFVENLWDKIDGEAKNLHIDITEKLPNLLIDKFTSMVGSVTNDYKDMCIDLSAVSSLAENNIKDMVNFLKMISPNIRSALNNLKSVIEKIGKDLFCILDHINSRSTDDFIKLGQCLGIEKASSNNGDLVVYILSDISIITNGVLFAMDDLINIAKTLKVGVTFDAVLTVVGLPAAVIVFNGISGVEMALYGAKILIRTLVTFIDVARSNAYLNRLFPSNVFLKDL